MSELKDITGKTLKEAKVKNKSAREITSMVSDKHGDKKSTTRCAHLSFEIEVKK